MYTIYREKSQAESQEAVEGGGGGGGVCSEKEGKKESGEIKESSRSVFKPSEMI